MQGFINILYTVGFLAILCIVLWVAAIVASVVVGLAILALVYWLVREWRRSD